jgi:hypothetical protein
MDLLRKLFISWLGLIILYTAFQKSDFTASSWASAIILIGIWMVTIPLAPLAIYYFIARPGSLKLLLRNLVVLETALAAILYFEPFTIDTGSGLGLAFMVYMLIPAAIFLVCIVLVTKKIRYKFKTRF